MGHSTLAPSAAKRWMTCTASVALLARLKLANVIEDEESSSYADEGTAAHALAACCLKSAVHPKDLVGTTIEGYSVDNEMARHVADYCEIVQRYGTPVVEQPVPLFHHTEDVGTPDACVINGTTLHIFDLKYGRGVQVDAKDNPQLRIYALSVLSDKTGFAQMFDITDVELHIIQPRFREGNYCSETLTVEDLFDWGITVTDAVRTISSGYGEYVVSEEGCRWCQAKAYCPKLEETALSEFDNLDQDKGEIVTVADDRIVNILAKLPAIEAFCKAVEARAIELCERGQLPGYKMVAGRANRVWTDQEAAEKLLRGKFRKEDITTSKLISPAQAEKLVKGMDPSKRFLNKFNKLIAHPEGKLTMVPISDPRPAINALGEFEDLTALPAPEINQNQSIEDMF